MPDIALCTAKNCWSDIRHTCYRYRAISSDYQSWTDYSQMIVDDNHCIAHIQLHSAQPILSINEADARRETMTGEVGRLP